MNMKSGFMPLFYFVLKMKFISKLLFVNYLA